MLTDANLVERKREKLRVREDERYDELEFTIARLGGTGPAGRASVGETYTLVLGSDVVGLVEVTAVAERLLKNLTNEDAILALKPPRNGLSDLLRKIEQLYKFRPAWRWDDTPIRLVRVRQLVPR